MSQNFFDIYVNRTGYAAKQMAEVINRNQITNEEVNNWVVED